MKIAGIIAEYNPFHNGHLYQIQKTKEETGADYIVVVMSGDFVQRGAPAIMDKHLRTEMALEAGADLVLELPVYYSTSSAELFSMGAVSLLDKLGCITHLSFGSESGDISLLKKISDLTLSESESYKKSLNDYMKAGDPYPLASAKAFSDNCNDPNISSQILNVMSEPNNTLGIAYVKALQKRTSSIIPYTIKREGGDYHDTSKGVFSASAVRRSLEEALDFSLLKDQLPENTLKIMTTNVGKTFPIVENDCSQYLIYKLRDIIFNQQIMALSQANYNTGLTSYVDIDAALAGRIVSAINQFTDYEQFCSILKTRNLTYAHISRALTHVILNIKKSHLVQFVQDDYIYYAKILGFKKSSSELLSAIKNSTDVPIISKLADNDKLLNDAGKTMLLSDIHAANLYEQLSCSKYGRTFVSEYSKQIIRKD